MVSGWRAQIEQDIALGSVRIKLVRPGPDDYSFEFINGFTDTGEPIVETLQRLVATPADAGFLLPAEALEALVEAVKPGPSKAELARLEEALAVERHRVDHVLTTVLGRPRRNTQVITTKP